MTVTIRQLHPHFFGEVSGVDLRKPLTPQEAADIEAGMDKYAVLLFRNQDITDEQQLAFALNFGERESARGGNITKKEDYRLTTGLNDVSNLGKDGKPLPRDSRQRLFNLGNMLWHSDSSFRAIPAKYSLLSARVVGGTLLVIVLLAATWVTAFGWTDPPTRLPPHFGSTERVSPALRPADLGGLGPARSRLTLASRRATPSRRA